MAHKIRIISKRDGFRRCGVAHSEEPAFHDLNDFTAAQMEELTTTPMLVVDLVEVGDDGAVTVVAIPTAQAKAAKVKASAKE